jgi:uncharacterized protein YfdQ (DUF2303 family)
VPNGQNLVKLEERRDRPERLKQTVTVYDTESFIKYFTDYCGLDSRVFVDSQKLQLVGVLDYHEVPVADVPAPRFCEHRLIYEFRHTPEWITWTGKNKVPFKQTQFAQFLEDNLPDIADPLGADLLQLCLTLEARKSANYSSAVRLDNGQVQMIYEEEIKGSAQKGTLEIPQYFTLVLIPFEGADAYRLKARLRYRLDEGSLILWYELERPHKILEDAVKSIVTKIAGGITNTITMGRISA